MKIKKTELDVDFIGGQSALTAAEEKALSDFFKQRKISSRLGSCLHEPISRNRHTVFLSASPICKLSFLYLSSIICIVLY